MTTATVSGALDKRHDVGLRNNAIDGKGSGKKGTKEVTFTEVDEELNYSYDLEALNTEYEEGKLGDRGARLHC